MKRIIVLFASSLIFSFHLFSQTPNWLWAKAEGGLGIDEGFSIAIDASGNIYTTGYFTGTADFDPGAGAFFLTSAGGADIFISKLDASGNFLWARRMGGINDDIGYGIAIDASGNVYTTGFYYGTVDFNPGAGVFNLTATSGADEMFISKLDSAGNFVWAKGVGADSGHFIAVDDSQNVYTTGYFQWTADFDPGPAIFNLYNGGVFILKLDISGNFVWAKAPDAAIGSADGLSIALDAQDNIYTTGPFQGIIDFDPGAGVYNLTPGGTTDIFILKLNSTGNFVWAKAMGGSGNIGGQSVTIDMSGNVYTTGWFQDTIDFDPGLGVFNLTSASAGDIFISKLDSSGNFLWAKTIGGTDPDEGRSIAVDGSGNVYSAGYFVGTADFDPGAGTFNLTSSGAPDIFVVKLDSSGNFIWAKAMGGMGDDRGYSMAANAFGNVYLTGSFNSSTISFDAITLMNTDNSGGSADIFIAKLDVLTGVETANSEDLLAVFPNPAGNNLFINGVSGKTEINIYNVDGQKVLEIPLIKAENEINISGLYCGIYFIRANDGNKILTTKFVKQ